MIKTGLPYDINMMEDIRNNGAIVDMNDLQFPSISDDRKIKTALVYLRNTGFNVELDFTNVSKEDKFEYLRQYLTSSIECKSLILAQSWSKIFNYTTGLNMEIPCILTDDEVKEFVENQLDMIGNALRLLISLPIYLIKRYKLDDDKTLDISEFEEITNKPIDANLINILKQPDINVLFTHDYDLEPANYTNIFTMDNNQLFNQLLDTDFGILFLCLTSDSQDKIKELISTLSVFKEGMK